MNAQGGSQASEIARRPPLLRLALGTVQLVVGFLSPLAIPFVVAARLPAGWTAILSGLLAFGIPEVLMMLAVAILGKAGYSYLMSVVGALLRKHGPPQTVGPRRYRVGLVLFAIPLLTGWLGPYVAHFSPDVLPHMILVSLAGDLVLLGSLVVLGGDFWDKVRALFIYEARLQRPRMGP